MPSWDSREGAISRYMNGVSMKTSTEEIVGVETTALHQSANFRGVHHLVLNTDDMKTTIDFYAGVLGMPLIHAMKVPSGINRGNPPFENLRHYFFDMGNDSMLAFFELPKGAKPKSDRDGVAAMQHVSFSVTFKQMEDLVKRLDEAGIERHGPIESAPGTLSCYFYDPNGTRLEASYQSGRGGAQELIEDFRMSREEILKELRTVTTDEKWLAWVTAGLD
jgi:catechol 2,3-dioxygenase-like lactoylglutathione lyase family enzyme